MDSSKRRLNKLRCFIEFHWTCILSGPSAPHNLSAQSVSSTEILVSWKAPANTNGKIKYRLSFYKTSELSAAPKLVYDGNATQHLVSNLKPYTRYTFKVLAYNVKYNLSSASIDTWEKTNESCKFSCCFEFLYGGTPPVNPVTKGPYTCKSPCACTLNGVTVFARFYCTSSILPWLHVPLTWIVASVKLKKKDAFFSFPVPLVTERYLGFKNTKTNLRFRDVDQCTCPIYVLFK